MCWKSGFSKFRACLRFELGREQLSSVSSSNTQPKFQLYSFPLRPIPGNRPSKVLVSGHSDSCGG